MGPNSIILFYYTASIFCKAECLRQPRWCFIENFVHPSRSFVTIFRISDSSPIPLKRGSILESGNCLKKLGIVEQNRKMKFLTFKAGVQSRSALFEVEARFCCMSPYF